MIQYDLSHGLLRGFDFEVFGRTRSPTFIKSLCILGGRRERSSLRDLASVCRLRDGRLAPLLMHILTARLNLGRLQLGDADHRSSEDHKGL